MFYSTTGAMLKVNFWNDAADFDIVTGKYIGFLAYPKNKCAIDFVDAFMDGRVTYVIDRKGTVRHIFRDLLNGPEHIKEAIRVLKEIQNQ